ncbi:class I adenylate-forming enzyme family protein [Glutamicibacter ardleyensis]|uniref:class I adenylate-forming enzyme family protein n=1 Tax=Glutamicibacter ardleyensis TaxID=225894 RepID=UPI003FD1ADA6
MSKDQGLHTLGCWTTDRSLSTPERIAIDDRGVRTTYRELERRAIALGAKFMAAGFDVGDRIATLSGNSADHVVLFFACAKAGLVLVPLSWRLTSVELREQLSIADPSLWVVEDEFQTLAEQSNAQLIQPVPVLTMGPAGVEASVEGPARERNELRGCAPTDDDPLLMVFTSGSEGKAKAVVLTHANCFWNNLALSRTVDLTSQDTILAVLPQYHLGGWNIQPLLAWWVGATVVLERTFDAGRALQLLADRKVTMMMGVPAHYRMLATHPEFESTDLTALRLAVVGGAPMPPSLLRCWHGRGVALVQGYGLSEAGPNVLCLASEEAMSKIGFAGRPYPHVKVKLVDAVTGEEIHGAGAGELLVSGPSVSPGYFRDAAASAHAFVNGWLRTGDLVQRDDQGYLKVIDRIKDLYISGGENVSPTEVEQVLLTHPAVAEAAVIGVLDDKWGEVGQAWVVLAAHTHADATELAAHCAKQLARYKIPATFKFASALPRVGIEKVSRQKLRDLGRAEQLLMRQEDQR